MFTATITSKAEVERGIEFTVQFTDGVKTIERTVIPQDENGLKYFVKGELDRLNAAPELNTKYEVGAEIDVTVPVVVTEPTQGDLYYRARYGLIELKQDVELGLANQAQYDAELARVIALRPNAVIKK